MTRTDQGKKQDEVGGKPDKACVPIKSSNTSEPGCDPTSFRGNAADPRQQRLKAALLDSWRRLNALEKRETTAPANLTSQVGKPAISEAKPETEEQKPTPPAKLTSPVQKPAISEAKPETDGEETTRVDTPPSSAPKGETEEQKPISVAPLDSIIEACKSCLTRADEQAERGAYYVAWDCLHQFDDEMLGAMESEELATHWCTLSTEATEKLKGSWRAEAAACLQAKVVGKVPTLHIARELQAHLATVARNQQFKIELFERGSLRLLTLLLAVIVVVATASASCIVFLMDAPGDVLFSWARALILGVPAGALGGILSMAFSLGRTDLKAKIPEMRFSRLVTGTRPLLAATVAIPVVVFVRAGYVEFTSFDGDQAILAFCFLAGFSERWFLGLMERFESGKK